MARKRQKHPKKELERVLQVFERRGWRVLDPPKYYTLLCPCGQHQRQFHISPSSAYYGNHALQWASKLPCWVVKDDDEPEGGTQ